MNGQTSRSHGRMRGKSLFAIDPVHQDTHGAETPHEIMFRFCPACQFDLKSGRCLKVDVARTEQEGAGEWADLYALAHRRIFRSKYAAWSLYF